MHTSALAEATKEYLKWHYSLEEGCEISLTDPPGKPLGCKEFWAITIYDISERTESLNGFYCRCGVQVVLSARLGGIPVENLEKFLFDKRQGLVTVRDAISAFLHARRWDIAQWGNWLASSKPVDGIRTCFVEAPVPTSLGSPVQRKADWWGETSQVTPGGKNSALTAESSIVGYSCDIVFNNCKAMQTDQPMEF